MVNNKPIFRFLAILVFILLIAFLLHTYILQSQGFPKFADRIVLSYIINFVVASIIYVGLFYFRNRIKTQIGFLFMAGSFLKFILFFVFFYPSYKADGNMATSEFAAFFVPYLICLALETIFTAKMLQKME